MTSQCFACWWGCGVAENREIGLTGEIRRVTRIEQRINEAAKLGFTKIYAPKNSLHGMKIPEGIQVVGVTTVGEVLKKVFS